MYLRTLTLELHGRGHTAGADISQDGNPRFTSATKIDAHRAAMVAAFRARLCELVADDPQLAALLADNGIEHVVIADAHEPGSGRRDGATVIDLG